ncbi:DUF3862 domain-containing protein [Clostridium felsineum]|uniref:DUF3862 domain-containing protein n=1 Tax=Clostridium felsineum TaxID=36839 RepID=UPI00098C32DD|nr:DUF3862 domain-containing protein [Clostridium felsineum]URZ17345.1 hypothetical protein CLFE_033980 [Clostridium felsineum DSM 794]
MKKRIIIILFFVLIILCSFLYFTFKPNTNNNNSKKPKINHTQSKTKKYTLTQFMKIRDGMNYNEVKSILGSNGKDLGAHYPSQSYEWSNDTQNNIWVEFHNGKILQKQHSLKNTNMDAKVTQNDFNKITIGMTYNNVVKILGQGELFIERYDSSHGQSYAWINHDGSVLSVVFQNGKVTGKSNKGLN